jgi:uncharacterized protein (TIGR00661 family)
LQHPVNILICPLDWGLGHATRCIPIIRHLLKLKCRVFIAGSGRSLTLLQTEFPESTFIRLKSYKYFYSRKARMVLSMIFSAPFIFYGIFRENQQLKKIIRQYKIQGVISDNRFGLWSSKVPCAYISHQIRIKAAYPWHFTEPLLYRIHRYFIKKYDVLWIPDHEKEPSLSGELVHNIDKSIHCRYIGPLSRFHGFGLPDERENKTFSSDILAIISGPEPQRSIFESIITRQAPTVTQKIVLLQGKPESHAEPYKKNNLTIYPHVETSVLVQMIANAGTILCRPGYSSIMDLAVLGKNAFFVPTPGQTEQEYLANYFQELGVCRYSNQQSFNLSEVAEHSLFFPGFGSFSITNQFEQTVEDFVECIRNKHQKP